MKPTIGKEFTCYHPGPLWICKGTAWNHFRMELKDCYGKRFKIATSSTLYIYLFNEKEGVVTRVIPDRLTEFFKKVIDYNKYWAELNE